MVVQVENTTDFGPGTMVDQEHPHGDVPLGNSIKKIVELSRHQVCIYLIADWILL
jgi:hypothetical protein